MRRSISIIVLLLTISLSGCYYEKNDTNFEIQDNGITSNSYSGTTIFRDSGILRATQDNNYKVLLGYEVYVGNDLVENDIIYIDVFNGEGAFELSYAIDDEDITEEPVFKSEVIDYSEFIDAKEDFQITRFDTDNDISGNTKFYWGYGEIATDKNGIYLLALEYRKISDIPEDKQGYMFVNVVDGKGTFKTFDKGYDLSNPNYDLNVLGAIKFNKCNNSMFNVTRFDMETSSDLYCGSGKIETNKKGYYLVMIKYTKQGGEPDDEMGHRVIQIKDGYGFFITKDSSNNVKGFEKIDKPEYEFEVVGYLEFRQ